MSDSLSIVVKHCAATLPDSMSQRKELLEALANLISPKHPALAVVEAQLAALVTIEQLQDRLQTVLPLKFKSKAGQ